MTHEHRRSFWALIATQGFGAFNDNLLKVLVQLLVIKWVADPHARSQLVVLGTVVFDAPFILFSMIAGRVADRFGKPLVIRGVQVWQFVVVAAAAVSVYVKSIPAMMASIFLLSMQAAFFSPAKYGLLPELLPERDLPHGNGILNMATFVAILAGILAGGLLASYPMWACALLIVAAIGGMVGSMLITPLPAAKPEERFAWNPLPDLLSNWRLIAQDRALQWAVIAVNYFWFVGSIFVTVVLLYASEMMGAGEKTSAALFAATTVGIGIGSILAGKWSRGRFNPKIVWIGAIGMSLFSIDLYWAWRSLPHAAFGFFMAGLSAGLYEIPLMALVQARSPATERGKILATQNFLSFVAIFIAAAVIWMLQTFLNLNPAQILLALGIFSLIGSVFGYRLVR
jgi:MFS family permease